MTLKQAMKERGLTAADLGAFFSTTEAHAARWMNLGGKNAATASVSYTTRNSISRAATVVPRAAN